MITEVVDERWYDKSSASYFTSRSTRNAQTISINQRHRPVFQLYVDLMVAIGLGTIMIISAIGKLRNMQQVNPTRINETDFMDVLHG